MADAVLEGRENAITEIVKSAQEETAPALAEVATAE